MAARVDKQASADGGGDASTGATGRAVAAAGSPKAGKSKSAKSAKSAKSSKSAKPAKVAKQPSAENGSKASKPRKQSSPRAGEPPKHDRNARDAAAAGTAVGSDAGDGAKARRAAHAGGDDASAAAARPLAAGWEIDPARLAALQQAYAREAGAMWEEMQKGAAPAVDDKRFGSAQWQQQPQFGWQAAWYLMNAEYLKRTAELIDTDRKTRERIRFFTQQWIDACSPANFLATNPDAQAELIGSGGESLRLGIENLVGDLKQGRMSQTDLQAFEVGRNVGTSPGEVVYENELVQLLQYAPSTATVASRPLLMVPPCINKFYILDLQPENSFIGHAVAQGNTVFVVSWRNVKAPQGHLGWDDYLRLGVVEPIRVVREICGVDTINALGFCVGGTIISAALAALAARGERPVASLTLLTTLLDFEEPGTLGVFIDEMQVAMREQQLARGGILSGRELATTFSFLRPNDLVWNYVVSNYLKGQSPPPFDLLFWNADSTNLAGPMFCWYLRHTYLQNELRIPGRLQSLGEPVDLTRIGVPTYVLATREDHIVPWPAAYASAQTLGGDPRFVLGASGHIAGVINPARKNKRSFWTGPPLQGLSRDEWLERAVEHPGSWWNDWSAWLARHEDGRIPARTRLGDDRHAPIEPAPGRYVKEPAD
ncbi:MAG: class I poly(R)-hydroxyalkanoic acid synthase [Lautropia sp.]